MAEKPCAYCGRAPRVAAFAPFCSRGCEDRDLLQWLGEGYKVPAVSNADELTDTPGLDSGDLDG
ncbi:DNA gyrase inhibitor YacG [Sandarakinorhabdus sp.]|uniref:DNA gyrase inhibitor YacG n=1 Tax=Sandarakinorhabdus sp. TaxID=1916663 RepID=UPI00286DA979|nr:DNA gyrase inhibitor YacG [Sandarakinorhabdus sp.]